MLNLYSLFQLKLGFFIKTSEWKGFQGLFLHFLCKFFNMIQEIIFHQLQAKLIFWKNKNLKKVWDRSWDDEKDYVSIILKLLDRFWTP